MGFWSGVGNFFKNVGRTVRDIVAPINPFDSFLRHKEGQVDLYKTSTSNANRMLGTSGLTQSSINSLFNKYSPTQYSQFKTANEASNLIYNNAISPELSRWANAELDKQRAEEIAGQNLLERQTAGQQASTFNRLATTSGLSSGAIERIGTQLARSRMQGLQDLEQQSRLSRLNTVATDMANKQKMLMASPGIFNQLTNIRQNWDTNRVGNLMQARYKQAGLTADILNKQRALQEKKKHENNFWTKLGNLGSAVASVGKFFL